MRYISNNEYENQMKKIRKYNISKERKRKLKEEKRRFKFRFKFPSTSKLVLLVVFLMCIEILIFSQYAMIKLGDISAMYTLISVPVTLVPITLGYYWKSKNENTASGVVFEKTMHELNQSNSYVNDEYIEIDSDEAQG